MAPPNPRLANYALSDGAHYAAPRKLGRDPFASLDTHPCERWHAWRTVGAHEVCRACSATRRRSRAPLVLAVLASVVSWIALLGAAWGVMRWLAG